MKVQFKVTYDWDARFQEIEYVITMILPDPIPEELFNVDTIVLGNSISINSLSGTIVDGHREFYYEGSGKTKTQVEEKVKEIIQKTVKNLKKTKAKNIKMSNNKTKFYTYNI